MLKNFTGFRTFTKIILFCFLLTLGTRAAAHLPRLVTQDKVVEISNPEVSQAFYAKLEGNPDVYQIVEDNSFILYTGILVPELPEFRLIF